MLFCDPLTLINIPFRTINPTPPSLAVILQEMKLTVTMRKIVLIVGILASLAVAQVVFAQSTEGVITYEVKTNMHRRLPPERAEMKTMIPEYRTTKEQLFFNADESLQKPLIEDEEDQEFSSTSHSGGGMRMVFRQPNVELYTQPATQKIVSKQEFMGKDYLVEDTLKMSPWKFGTETKEIMGYQCKQAYFTRTEEQQTFRVTGSGPPAPEKKMVTQEITAWYTDQIRGFLGPEKFNSLPGTVLAIDINNGERVIVAAKVELRPLKKNELKVPEKGQKISQADFRKMVDEQMQQMRSSGGMIIRN
jgi:GLPGLI family protein